MDLSDLINTPIDFSSNEIHNEGFLPKFPTTIDSTMRAAFVACPHKFYRSYIRGIHSPYESVHLHFGGAIARGIEVARKCYYIDGMSPYDAIDQGNLALLEYWGDADFDNEKKTLESCIEAFELYLTKAYPLGSDSIVPYQIGEHGHPIIENSFAIPIDVGHPETGQPLLYSGRHDMVAVLRSAYGGTPWRADQVWSVDEKTTSQMGPTWANQWRLRGQFIGYTWALRQLDIPCVGTLVRGICIYKSNQPKFQEAYVQVSSELIDRWYRQLRSDVLHMVECWRSGYWDFNLGESCSAYGGCDQLKLCELSDPEPYILANYSEKRWDPIERKMK